MEKKTASLHFLITPQRQGDDGQSLSLLSFRQLSCFPIVKIQLGFSCISIIWRRQKSFLDKDFRLSAFLHIRCIAILLSRRTPICFSPSLFSRPQRSRAPGVSQVFSSAIRRCHGQGRTRRYFSFPFFPGHPRVAGVSCWIWTGYPFPHSSAGFREYLPGKLTHM